MAFRGRPARFLPLCLCALLPPPVVLPWDVANTSAAMLGNPEKAPVGPPLPCSRSFIPFAPSMDLLLLSCLPGNHSFLPALMPQYLGLSPHFWLCLLCTLGFSDGLWGDRVLPTLIGSW